MSVAFPLSTHDLAGHRGGTEQPAVPQVFLLFPFLKMSVMFPRFQSRGISPVAMTFQI